jgi:iron complex transport system ATP-binding protein
MPEAGAVIEVRDAGMAFGARWIFRRLSFVLPQGETLAILGRNGRGKTTLLRALLGLQPWSEGGARIFGSAGYVPQSASVPFAYSVLDLVLTGRARHLGMFAVPGEADYRAARAALEALGMLGFEERQIDELSGGERQLVLTARAGFRMRCNDPGRADVLPRLPQSGRHPADDATRRKPEWPDGGLRFALSPTCYPCRRQSSADV